MVKRLTEDYIRENDSHLREQLSFITEAQKELLYAIHAEGQVQSITSNLSKFYLNSYLCDTYNFGN